MGATSIQVSILFCFINDDELAFIAVSSSRGGFGEVWKCKMGETSVAVKKLLSHWLESDSSTAIEFESEVEILKKLRHPNIVMFFGAGTKKKTCSAINFITA